jgi:hypothetical protein
MAFLENKSNCQQTVAAVILPIMGPSKFLKCRTTLTLNVKFCVVKVLLKIRNFCEKCLESRSKQIMWLLDADIYLSA